MKQLLSFFILLSFVCKISAQPIGEPHLKQVGLVAPDVLALTIHTGTRHLGKILPVIETTSIITHGKQKKVTDDQGNIIGVVIGPEQDYWKEYDHYYGSDIDWQLLDDQSNYKVVDGSNQTVEVKSVYRVSKPTDMVKVGGWDADPAFQFPMEHLVYLQMDKELAPGALYTLTFSEIPLPAATYANYTINNRTPALHVNQLGFRSDDPLKVGYLSTWLGKGGSLNYQPNQYHLIDTKTNSVVYTGSILLQKQFDQSEMDVANKNYSYTNVYKLDFSDFQEPGEYKIWIETLGTSYPFEIRPNVYNQALLKSLRSYYHHRNGIALGPPYTDYIRPRGFHPEDGVVIYQSTTSLKKMGNANFEKLLEGATEEVVPNAWGGLMDAGDWDRRAGHIPVTTTFFDLYTLFPKVFDTLKFNIPESDNHLPDIIDEALFNLDVYRRLQMDNGAIRGGIESAEHPKEGEVSWLESWKIYAYGPGAMSTFRYAGAAAYASYILREMDPELSQMYLNSALKAMTWAEKEIQQPLIEGEFSPDDPDFVDERNQAAIYLYKATGNKKWHQTFLNTTKFKDPNFSLWQGNAKDYRRNQRIAWSYVLDVAYPRDKKVLQNCKNMIFESADFQLDAMQAMSFPFVKHPDIPRAWGRSGSFPEANVLIMAHLLSGEQKYLSGIVETVQFGLGANPLNLVYTSGVGYNPVKNLLHVDSRKSGQEVPEGITVYGNTDNTSYIKEFWTWRHLDPVIYPPKAEWPANQSFYDVYWLTPSNEYTVNNSPLYTTIAWAYLAFRE
ncbi:MAG: glycoside hydrolase family 9 protein [Candidatus Cyclobacteriaceae bacterium M3_2C_046]